MKTTQAFEQDLQDWFDEMLNDDPDFKNAVRRQIEAAAETGFTQIEIDVMVGDGKEAYPYPERFRFKPYVDPYSSDREIVLASPDEKVVEWADSVSATVWQDALLPGNPETCVVTYDPENNHENNPSYLALHNDGMGDVRVESFDEWHFDEALRGACAFAWGLSLKELDQAQEMSIGFIREEVDAVYPSPTAQGFVYKNAFAFMMKNDEVCYIPEHGLDVATHFGDEYVLSECEGYTYQDFVDICMGNERVAKHVFSQVDWQSPSAYFEEMEPDEIAEVAAGVYLDDGYELLEYKGVDTVYLGDRHLSVPFPVFHAHAAGVDVCYCGNLNRPLNIEDLRIIEDDKLPDVGFMTEDKMRHLPVMSVNRSWLDALEKDAGITVFHEEGPLSLGVRLESGQQPEEADRYIYSLFIEDEPIADVGHTTLAYPWPDEIISKLTAEWNNAVRAMFETGLSRFKTPREIQFVSTTDEKLPAFASLYNADMRLGPRNELLELQQTDLPVPVFYAHRADCYVADFRDDLDERVDLDVVTRVKARVELLRVIDANTLNSLPFVTEDDMQAVSEIVQDDDFAREIRGGTRGDKLLMENGKAELRVQYVPRPEGEVYVYYMLSPFGAGGVRDLIITPTYEPWNEGMAKELARAWNAWAKADLFYALPTFNPDNVLNPGVKGSLSVEEAFHYLGIAQEHEQDYLADQEFMRSLAFADSRALENHLSYSFADEAFRFAKTTAATNGQFAFFSDGKVYGSNEKRSEIRFVSTTDEKLPAFASSYNVLMQEKPTFRRRLDVSSKLAAAQAASVARNASRKDTRCSPSPSKDQR